MTEPRIDLDPANTRDIRILEAGLILAKHLAYSAALVYYPNQADQTDAVELWIHSDPSTRHLWRMRAMEFLRGLDPHSTARVVTTGLGGKVIGRIGAEE
jgi:hypothetical protein